jgi:hypothetical protein
MLGRQIMPHDFEEFNQTTWPQNRASLAGGFPSILPTQQHAQSWDPVNQVYSLSPPPRQLRAGQQVIYLGRTSQPARLNPGLSTSATYGNTPDESQTAAQDSGRRVGLHRLNDSIFTTFGKQPPSIEGHGRPSEASGDQNFPQFGYSECQSSSTSSDHLHIVRRNYPHDGNSHNLDGSYGL